jgi:hypothetical protein
LFPGDTGSDGAPGNLGYSDRRQSKLMFRKSFIYPY